MNFLKLSTKKIFIIIGFGYGFTALLLSLIIYLITDSIIGSIISLLVSIVLSIWAFILVSILQKQISLFTNDICEIIDEMMSGNELPQHFSDKENLFSVIVNMLQRLFNSMKSNKEVLDKERSELQALISDISHQVKTPTTNLKIAALTLKEEHLSVEDQTVYLQSMIDQVDKLEFLMGSLVKSSRLETGVIMLEKYSMRIYETLATTLGSIFLKAEEKQLIVTVDCDENIKILHDTKWTAEALYNILDNAVKYTPKGGSINISVAKWESYTKIDITDTGIGISESNYGAIFKRFYREAKVHYIDGIGIGLYLSREIISKQGGYIKVKSEIDKGTTFSVFLPNN